VNANPDTGPTFAGPPRVVKEVADRLVAGILLLLLAPVLIASVIAVRSDGGPVFSRQIRVGRDGRPFTLLKFRCTVVPAEQHGSGPGRAEESAGPCRTTRSELRTTPVGRVLARYSLDELPQLLEVLTGAMSLVGPRPSPPAEVAGHLPEARRTLLVKPGLTGLWQISGRGDLSWEESARLDLRYVENWSLALDLRIIRRTVGAVLKGTRTY
jgi:lipopolysaccharide/colanic/teichoic acid biosynthesis glycosyltransferase